LIVNVPTSELGAAVMRHNYSAVDQRSGVGAFEKSVALNTPDFVGGYRYVVPNGTAIHAIRQANDDIIANSILDLIRS
jgi:hypothetical protein